MNDVARREQQRCSEPTRASQTPPEHVLAETPTVSRSRKVPRDGSRNTLRSHVVHAVKFLFHEREDERAGVTRYGKVAVALTPAPRSQRQRSSPERSRPALELDPLAQQGELDASAAPRRARPTGDIVNVEQQHVRDRFRAIARASSLVAVVPTSPPLRHAAVTQNADCSVHVHLQALLCSFRCSISRCNRRDGFGRRRGSAGARARPPPGAALPRPARRLVPRSRRDNWLLAIGNDGGVSPFAFNSLSDSEFAGASFSPDGETLFANIQSDGLTVAIWGPWAAGCRGAAVRGRPRAACRGAERGATPCAGSPSRASSRGFHGNLELRVKTGPVSTETRALAAP